jgi:hypothetical protein
MRHTRPLSEIMAVMGGRGVAWVPLLPLAAVGWLSAHSLAYVLVEPDPEHRAELLVHSGHGYLGVAPLILACAITLVLAGLALAIREGLRGGARARVPLWPVALMPPLGFAVQEHLERLIELNAFPFGAVLEPTFLVGMALQLPFALVAITLARTVLALGDLIGRVLALRRSARPRAQSQSWRLPRWLGLRPLRPLAAGNRERAPPDAGGA